MCYIYYIYIVNGILYVYYIYIYILLMLYLDIFVDDFIYILLICYNKANCIR